MALFSLDVTFGLNKASATDSSLGHQIWLASFFRAAVGNLHLSLVSDFRSATSFFGVTVSILMENQNFM